MERTEAYEQVKVSISEAELTVATQIFKRAGITKMQAIHAAGIASEEFAKAILPALKPPAEWQTIETAPRDGSVILGDYTLNGTGEDVHTVLFMKDWDEENQGQWRDSANTADWREPLRWMPLPTAPLPR